MENTSSRTPRYPLIDYIRFSAIALMIFFHFFYDLNIFKVVTIDFTRDNIFWYGLPRLIVFLFLTAVGISLCLTHKDSIKWYKFWPRFLKLCFFALVISLTTYYMFPKQWVYFGTLHCIAACSLMALPLIRFPKASLALGLGILITHYFFTPIPWIKLPHPAMDYIPAFPWVAIVYLGIFAHHLDLHLIPLPENKLVAFTSKHSLKIYLIHQPILYALSYLISKIVK